MNKEHFKLDNKGTITHVKTTMPAPIPASELSSKTDNSKYMKSFEHTLKADHYFKVNDNGILHINAGTLCINKLSELPIDDCWTEPVEITKAEFNAAKYQALKALDII